MILLNVLKELQNRTAVWMRQVFKVALLANVFDELSQAANEQIFFVAKVGVKS
jgi:hypothetical protein